MSYTSIETKMTAMDYTTLPRGLFYRERKSLEEFTKGNKLNTILVENMEDFDFMFEGDFAPNALLCMNAAYYICTEIMLEAKPLWKWSVYKEQSHCQSGPHYRDFQNITLTIVYLLLQGCDRDWLRLNEKFLKKIMDFVDGNYTSRISFVDERQQAKFHHMTREFHHQMHIAPLLKGTDFDYLLPPDEFAPRDIRDNDISIRDIARGIDYVVEAIRKFPDESEQERFIEGTLKSFSEVDSYFINTSGSVQMFHDETFSHAGEILHRMLWDLEPEEMHLPFWLGDSPSTVEQQVKPSDQTALEEELAQTKKKLDEALSKVKERDQKIAAQEVKIAELQEQIDFFQGKRDAMSKRPDLRGGVKVGLTRNQARVMTEFLAKKLNLNLHGFNGGKGKAVGYIAKSLWGYSAEKVRQDTPDKKDREYVANIFAPFSSDIAKEISDTGKKKSHHTGEKKA